MNILAYDLYCKIFLHKDGSNRTSAFHSALKAVWGYRAFCFMTSKARFLPHRNRVIYLSKGESQTLVGFWYEHVDCPDQGGYFSLEYDGNNLIVSSTCESDHPGPGKEDCVYVDGFPIRRNETRTVSKYAEIVYMDYVDTHKHIDDWVWAFIRVVPVLS